MMQAIQSYIQYREYLSDFFQITKQDRPSFTWAEFSKNCGFSSGNHLWQIVQGHKLLTIKSIHDIAFFLGLSSREHDFFETLVHWNKAKTKKVASVYARRRLELLASHEPRPTSKVVEKSVGQALIGDPLVPISLMVLQNQEVGAASRVLAGILGINEDKAQKLILNLQSEGLLMVKEGVFFRNGLY